MRCIILSTIYFSVITSVLAQIGTDYFSRIERNMISVRSGSFDMGCFETHPIIDQWPEEDKDCIPLHKVYLKEFEIGKFEVTNADFIYFLNDISDKIQYTPTGDDGQITLRYGEHLICSVSSTVGTNSKFVNGTLQNTSDRNKPRSRYPYASDKNSREEDNAVKLSYIKYNFGSQPGGRFFIEESLEFMPVVRVTWYGAVEYCNWLNDKMQLPQTERFRLPTEAEWEYAAFSAGDFSYGQSDRNLRYGNSSSNSYDRYDKEDSELFLVGIGLPNRLGIFNMQDNVAEFCSDWYGDTHYRYSVENNPVGPVNGNLKVFRGAATRVTKRNKIEPTGISNEIGFRLVRDVQ